MKTQTLALTILSTAFLILGLGTCSKSPMREHVSAERCRVNKVIVIDDYQEGRSVYPTRTRWILETNEGYRVISYNGNYQVGDSIDIEVRKFYKYNRNK